MLNENPILKVLVPALRLATYAQMMEFTEYIEDNAESLYTGELGSLEYAEVFSTLVNSYDRYLEECDIKDDTFIRAFPRR